MENEQNDIDESLDTLEAGDIAEEIVVNDSEIKDSEDEEMDYNEHDEDQQQGEHENDADEILFQDDSIQGFFAHGENPVYAVATSPTDINLICSAGGDDKAYLWRKDTGAEVAILDGHKDSCIAVQFSFDGKFVATGGMDGQVRVYDLSNNNALYCILEGPDEVNVSVFFNCV